MERNRKQLSNENTNKYEKIMQNGITLIALMITVIVLLIIVGVTLNLTLGERGIFKTATKASILSKISEIEEAANLSYMERKVEEITKGEKVVFAIVINDLKQKGYKIEEIVSGSNEVTNIVLSEYTLKMERNSEQELTYTLVYGEGIVKYFAEVQGKYYEILFNKGNIKVEKEEKNIEKINASPKIEVSVDDENIVTAKKEESKKIIINSKNKEGEASVKVEEENSGINVECKVTVVIPEIKLSQSKVQIEMGETEDLEATVTPEEIPNKNIKWKSKDEDIATVENGKITGVQIGKTEITAELESNSEINKTCTVEVTLPTNKVGLPSGTQVKKPSDKNWGEDVNAYTDGEGNTIPVPVGFTPILVTEGQGTIATGFVIRDTSTNADGSPSDTNGNEFVWIPCEIETDANKNDGKLKYNRYAFTRTDWDYKQTEIGQDTGTNSEKIEVAYPSIGTYYYTEARSSDEQTSVTTYGGYYIGRYESGISKGSARTANNESQTAEQIEAVSGKAIIQAGKEVYNYVTKEQAEELAKRVYTGKSRLCSSYGWDTALKYIDGKTGTYAINSTDGNYIGKGGLKNTGYHGVKNIYDMGGNVLEWTTESCSNGSNICTRRGGAYGGSASKVPAALRYYNSMTDAFDYVGFRVTLYM